MAMIESQLRPEGVTDAAVLSAMAGVAREAFVPADMRPVAYTDRSLPLGQGRFMVAPTVLGRLLTEISPQPGERALIVGGGSGYSAAVLSALGVDVVLLEVDAALADQARANGFGPVSGELARGYARGAPYDVILIDGAVEQVPDALVAQLADGGRLGTGLVDGSVSRLAVGRKSGEAFGIVSLGDAGIPALPGFARPVAFTF
jgi:protein-L-isoaspartate(D-aspartate) O-methyltransferase